MTLEQLRIFLEVARQEHVTRAAAALNLTQSTVSAAIRTLEERHGVRLFDRLGRSILLTAEGRLFVPAAMAALAAARGAVQVLDDLSGTAVGALSVATSQTVATQWLPRRLVAFRQAHPGLRLELQVCNTRECVAAVRDGRCDVAFVEGDVPDDPAGAALMRQVVGRDRLVLVVGSRHPWCARPPGGLAGLRGAAFVLREAGSGTRQMFEAALAAAGLSLAELEVFLELPSNEAICAAIAGTALATVVSRAVAEPYLPAGGLVELPLAVAERPFLMIRNPDRHHSRALQALERVIEAAAVPPFFPPFFPVA